MCFRVFRVLREFTITKISPPITSAGRGKEVGMVAINLFFLKKNEVFSESNFGQIFSGKCCNAKLRCSVCDVIADTSRIGNDVTNTAPAIYTNSGPGPAIAIWFG